MRLKGLASALAGVLTLIAVPAHAAQSFIYVAPSCQDTAGCSTSVLVYDADTGGLAASIPLPADMNPFALKLSQDGQRLYVGLSRAGGTSVAVIDTTRHVMLGTHDAAGAVGQMAVNRDGSRLFFAAGTTLFVYDTAANAVVATPATGGLLQSIAASPSSDRIYTVEGLGAEAVRQYDSLSGAPVPGGATTGDLFWSHIHVSRDGSRAFLTAPVSGNHPSSGGFVTIFDTSNWAAILTGSVRPFPVGSVEAATRGLLFSWESGHVNVSDSSTLAHLGDVNLSARPVNVVVNADESRAWLASTASTNPPSINALYGIDLASLAVVQTIELSGSSSVEATPPNASVCNYQVDTKQRSYTRDGGTASIHLRTPCAWTATRDVPWVHLNAFSGSGDATLGLIVDPNPTINTRTATLSIGGRLVTVTQAGPFTDAAFGFIDTPADNTTGISGAMSVTGWALDDVGVARVSIFRDPVAGEPDAPIFIGDATFVDGARPDVQAVFPAFPGASRAGWGLQILTNMLPGGGNSTYRLLVFAEDTEGHTTLLGTRTFTAANDSATIPFGTIDTPTAGQTVSGTITNFGWALTPQPAFIPSGSTIDVLVDGVVVGHPTYGFARSDIDTFFPGFMNSGAAVGFFMLDTTTLANGLHTIAWVVHDNLGGTQGIGSRVFFVDNP